MVERTKWPIPLWGPGLGLVILLLGFHPQLAGIVAFPALLPLMPFGNAIPSHILVLAYPVLAVAALSLTIYWGLTTGTPDDRKWLLNLGLFLTLAFIGAYVSLLTMNEAWQSAHRQY